MVGLLNEIMLCNLNDLLFIVFKDFMVFLLFLCICFLIDILVMVIDILVDVCMFWWFDYNNWK